MKSIIVNANLRVVQASFIDAGTTLHELFPDAFDLAGTLPNGDSVYVDDSGLTKPAPWLIKIHGIAQPLPALAVIVGEEHPGTGETREPRSSIEGIKASVTWLSHRQFRAWARAQAQPAIAVADEVILSWPAFAELSRPRGRR